MLTVCLCLCDALRARTEMHHNPVAEEAHYRLRVIAAIPELRILDMHVIDELERESSRKRCESTPFLAPSFSPSLSPVVISQPLLPR